MTPPILDAAAQVITSASRTEPADAVLRRAANAFKNKADRRSLARAVFCFFRWRGWVEPACIARDSVPDAPVSLKPKALQDAIHDALELQDRFKSKPHSFSDEELAQKSVPAWVLDCLPPAPGWLRAIQAEPRVWVRAKVGEAASLASQLGQTRPAGTGILSHALEYLGQEDLFSSPAFHAGEFEIQDLASQMVSLLIAPQPGEKWWDACAGEGGKTLHLSNLMRNQGLIFASDRAAWRLDKLKVRAARAGMFNYRVGAWDGGPKLPTKTAYDGVLLDAPCSGIGTWQKNPHARWTLSPNDVIELRDKQRALLEHVAKAVKPGGKLAYAVCTLSLAETVEIAEAFNQRDSTLNRFEPLLLTLSDGSIESTGPTHTWWPQQLRGNGMYVATWKRVV